ncbi:class I SAM-dependent methyltransferase [Halioxenophilus sp. WMMB6]|uniref:class I SAM-dependent methyltransferase n=1 Tax=Halioxenophilus sp. WMMB6 TaxID=3073815 RepID=UPI00295EB34C|nr:class I SAM-dependent methyltransferase [Halioxenophilus sp. WMMB6]
MVADISAYVAVLSCGFADRERALAQRLQTQLVNPSDLPSGLSYLLAYGEEGLELINLAAPKTRPIRVDFATGKAQHRRLYGGGQGQMIAKAVGVSSRFKPKLLDCTAGMGGDGFVLACLGCSVTLLERNPVVHALLADGLARAAALGEPELDDITGRLRLINDDAIGYLQTLPGDQTADVIYLDPMFPERKKSAAVKKEMQFFHSLVGADLDQTELLMVARSKAVYRVVVKRPRLAEAIGEQQPSFQVVGKTSRYDIYVNKKIPG